ncbi:MAG TPA: Scr1 family TA system antitoxin-like transcriptional regulator [Candidatus Limnocylindrales bacterium]|nr:Scr1 family TA system antitoxin-like transcriptional regulator [Candidatus Limnocylindrales bacterium]
MLRDAREAAQLSQGATADKLGWSLSKVQRIESGEVNVSGTDLRAMLDLYGIVSQAEPLVTLARFARRRSGSWHDAALRHLDGYTHDLVQFEHDAKLIRWCESGWLPDPLHTDRYATARLDYLSTIWTAAQCQAYAAVSQLRRDLYRGLFDGRATRRPRYQVVLDEAVIHRPYGGYPVLREQLEVLLDHARAGQVELAIIAFETANPLAADDPFTLIEVDHTYQLAQATVLALHSQQRLTTDPPVLQWHHRRWDKLRAACDPTRTELTLLRRLDTIHRMSA